MAYSVAVQLMNTLEQLVKQLGALIAEFLAKNSVTAAAVKTA